MLLSSTHEMCAEHAEAMIMIFGQVRHQGTLAH